MCLPCVFSETASTLNQNFHHCLHLPPLTPTPQIIIVTKLNITKRNSTANMQCPRFMVCVTLGRRDKFCTIICNCPSYARNNYWFTDEDKAGKERGQKEEVIVMGLKVTDTAPTVYQGRGGEREQRTKYLRVY